MSVMRRFRVPLLAWTTMAGYLLATLGATWFHQHAHVLSLRAEEAKNVPPTEDHGHCDSHHRHHNASGGHSHRECDGSGHNHSPHVPPHDDDCFVCQYLAAKLLSAAEIVLDIQADWVADVATPVIAAPDAPILGLPRSRGPPCLAVVPI